MIFCGFKCEEYISLNGKVNSEHISYDSRKLYRLRDVISVKSRLVDIIITVFYVNFISGNLPRHNERGHRNSEVGCCLLRTSSRTFPGTQWRLRSTGRPQWPLIQSGAVSNHFASFLGGLGGTAMKRCFCDHVLFQPWNYMSFFIPYDSPNLYRLRDVISAKSRLVDITARKQRGNMRGSEGECDSSGMPYLPAQSSQST